MQAILNRASESIARQIIGPHYAKVMRPEKIRKKNELDGYIMDILKTGKGLILSGPVGVGKTTDLVYITKRIINAKMVDYAEWLLEATHGDPDVSTHLLVTKIKHVLSYHFAPELFNQLHEGKDIEITPYFIIDDFGRQYNEPFAVSRFEALIEELYRTEKTLILTTNLTRNELLGIEGWGRITDRIREMCSFFVITGTSMRHK